LAASSEGLCDPSRPGDRAEETPILQELKRIVDIGKPRSSSGGYGGKRWEMQGSHRQVQWARATLKGATGGKKEKFHVWIYGCLREINNKFMKKEEGTLTGKGPGAQASNKESDNWQGPFWGKSSGHKKGKGKGGQSSYNQGAHVVKQRRRHGAPQQTCPR